jgi:ribosomal protein L11 methyltransferase
MDYIEAKIKTQNINEFQLDLLKQDLADIGFDSFIDDEENHFFLAYIPIFNFDESKFLDLKKEYDFVHVLNQIRSENWNEEWEKNFSPIVVEDFCYIRADFHPKSEINYPYEIVITPKMSFGTGHHQTTYLMIKALNNYDFEGLKILDMGAGTGILAIFAALKGAKDITAIDIDDICTENCIENFERNNIKFDKNKIFTGDKKDIPAEKFDVIIANINRNVLLDQMAEYNNKLKENGKIFLSGFYQEDVPVLQKSFGELGFKIIEQTERNNWTCLVISK